MALLLSFSPGCQETVGISLWSDILERSREGPHPVKLRGYSCLYAPGILLVGLRAPEKLPGIEPGKT